jgi:hypothetical protein
MDLSPLKVAAKMKVRVRPTAIAEQRGDAEVQAEELVIGHPVQDGRLRSEKAFLEGCAKG